MQAVGENPHGCRGIERQHGPRQMHGDAERGSMAAWFDSGRYVANTTRQTELFGPAPTPEDAIARFAAGLGH